MTIRRATPTVRAGVAGLCAVLLISCAPSAEPKNHAPGSSAQSGGPTSPEPEVVLPHVVGMQQDDAEKRLKDLGFPLTIIIDERWEPKGSVIRQNPSGGTLVRRGSPVTIKVSNGNGPLPSPPPRPHENPDHDDDGSGSPGEFGMPGLKSE